MKEFNKKPEYTASAWGEEEPDCVLVLHNSGNPCLIRHESQIPTHWPDDLKSHVRSEILAHRPEGENEARTVSILWQFRWHEGERQERGIGVHGFNIPWRKYTPCVGGSSEIYQRCNARAEAWFEANRPKPEWQEVPGAPGYAVKAHDRLRCYVQTPNAHSIGAGRGALLDGTSWVFSHPEPVIAAVCRLFEIPRADVMREDEGMHYESRYTFTIEGSGVRVQGAYCDVLYERKDLERLALSEPYQSNWASRALAYLNKHAPKLAADQVLCMGVVHTLRWHEGTAQHDCTGRSMWVGWTFGTGGYEAGDAWFRANCPADRFVTEDGKVLEFRMRDEDGEAECLNSSSDVLGSTSSAPRKNGTMKQYGGHYEQIDVLDKLIKYRDAERAKWTYEVEGNLVSYENESEGYIGTFNGKNHSGSFCQLAPTYVRTRAEQMWREREPEWRTEWHPRQDAVGIYEGSICRAYISKGTNPPPLYPLIPPHILTEARAKFRANYTLQRDEIWFQGMPVRMEFGYDGTEQRTMCSLPAGLLCWSPVCESVKTWGIERHFTDDVERLAAYDRMRAFYYEKHPGKCRCPNGLPLTFELRNGAGVAVSEQGAVRMRLDSDVNEFWKDEHAKLARWTAEQLKKLDSEKPKPPAWRVVAEAYMTDGPAASGEPASIRLQEVLRNRSSAFRGCENLLRSGPLRVTIEPADNK